MESTEGREISPRMSWIKDGTYNSVPLSPVEVHDHFIRSYGVGYRRRGKVADARMRGHSSRTGRLWKV